jgi:hypothetical protein
MAQALKWRLVSESHDLALMNALTLRLLETGETGED